MTLLDDLGAGAPFPLAPADGQLPLLSGPEKIRQSIMLILETEPGERIMRPDFGCGLSRFLMEPNNEATAARLKTTIEDALDRWEPRIELTEVRVVPGGDPAELLVTIRYRHVRDGTAGGVFFPFRLGGA